MSISLRPTRTSDARRPAHPPSLSPRRQLFPNERREMLKKGGPLIDKLLGEQQQKQ